MRLFRWLRWHLAKRRLASPFGKVLPHNVRETLRRHHARAEDFPPDAEGYERLASAWDDYGGPLAHAYLRFLPAAAEYHGRPTKAVLDLACGTGRLTRRLAGWAESVVGLDASEAMLRRAGSLTGAKNVRYVRGDFRDFRLGETFDAAVCCGDSFNYVGTPGEVTEVFRCVHCHLRPGGILAFDVLDDRAFRALAGWKIVASVDDVPFEVYFFYDPAARVSESRVVLGGAVERHQRVPLEDADIRRSAGEGGLEVADHFRSNPWLTLYARDFYVLRKP